MTVSRENLKIEAILSTVIKASVAHSINNTRLSETAGSRCRVLLAVIKKTPRRPLRNSSKKSL